MAALKPPENLTVVLKLLLKYYPDAHCALYHRNAFELLVATILSAQCTDERVNQVTPFLFDQFPTPQKMAMASIEDVELHLRSVNFYKNKAKNLIACASALVEKHAGNVPENLEDLVELAGVGRKTANVVLGNAFNKPSGLVVDTHVARLSFRLGWVKSTDPVDIETRLGKFIPKDKWVQLPHELIFHGRQVCKARTPLCETCFLFEHCPKKGVSKG
ncbi:MAG: endonuclease III [Bdellovibrionaceae bacterium]|nr:endonuclease III [Pseudobdellovibrionaceae bacterium]